LGYVLSDGQYQLGKKAINKLFGVDLPDTRVKLQSLLGKLNFASTFIPQFKQKVAPIVQLLGKHSDGKWGPLQTETLNQIAAMIVKRCKLGICNSLVPATLYVDEDGHCINAILT
jgi:hypothetical protein